VWRALSREMLVELKELLVTIPDDLASYLALLEKLQYVKSKKQVVATALAYYKMLGMHDWAESVYRIGGSRVFFVDQGMLMEMFHALTNEELLELGMRAALRRKIENPNIREIDTTDRKNWPLILKDLEIMGWGLFYLVRGEIRIDLCVIPAPYLIGYLSTLLGKKFKHHPTQISHLVVLVPEVKERDEKGSGRKSGRFELTP